MYTTEPYRERRSFKNVQNVDVKTDPARAELTNRLQIARLSRTAL